MSKSSVITMPYIKKNVNLLLLLLVVLVVAAFAGLSSYYQETYKNISTSYKIKTEELRVVVGNLSEQEKALSKMQKELELRTSDKAKFEAMYSNLSDLKEKLKKELANTRDELESTKVDLANTQSQLTSALTQIDALNAEVTDLKAKVRARNKLINELKSLLCPFNQTYC
jgi:chromosome segregation ATPase